MSYAQAHANGEQTNNGSCKHKSMRPVLTPGWSPINIALMVAGFMLFWPLGLGMLAFNIWGDKWNGFTHDVKRQFNTQTAWAKKTTNWDTAMGNTGNAAFDEYRKQELDRLQAEREKLEAMRKEFDDYVTNLRKAKDQEEFNRFMKDYKVGSQKNSDVIDV